MRWVLSKIKKKIHFFFRVGLLFCNVLCNGCCPKIVKNFQFFHVGAFLQCYVKLGVDQNCCFFEECVGLN